MCYIITLVCLLWNQIGFDDLFQRKIQSPFHQLTDTKEGVASIPRKKSKDQGYAKSYLLFMQ